MLIQEIILENFMSYEYARVPFSGGINLVCGPNGSGKSSLLLAISVALGQSYTERSRKLSDLIRWGKEQARVTLILNNSKQGRRRPVTRFGKDQVFLTRVLRRDGKYWFELENRAATKSEVKRLLARLGVDPDNMLIVMHQNMVEQFTVLSPQEKLLMVESAVGIEPYRRNVRKARRKLTRMSSQANSMKSLLESAEQTLNYWREQYDRYQEKKQLQAKRRFLARELAWAEAARIEALMEELVSEINSKQSVLRQIQEEMQAAANAANSGESQIKSTRAEWRRLLDKRLTLENEKGRASSAISIFDQLASETRLIEDGKQKGNPLSLSDRKASSDRVKLLRSESLKDMIATHNQRLNELNNSVTENMKKMDHLEGEMDLASSQILDNRIDLAVCKYREESLEAEIDNLRAEKRNEDEHLVEAVKKAGQVGSKIAVVKEPGAILDEIRITDGHLAALNDVSEDIERMYESYSKLFLELKEKARLAADNREKALDETRARTQAWREVAQALLEGVDLQYQEILRQVQAIGEVSLVDEHDIETAGLTIRVGFKGGKPVPLNAYTQSGGERTTSTVGFLLALQQHVRSPFRAVDEFDIHMDPKNRETIARLLVSSVQDESTQYLVLTPSQIPFTGEDINLITVQNVKGKSAVKKVS